MLANGHDFIVIAITIVGVRIGDFIWHTIRNYRNDPSRRR